MEDKEAKKRLLHRLENNGGTIVDNVYKQGSVECGLEPLDRAIKTVLTSQEFTHLPQALGNSSPLPIADMYVDLALSPYKVVARRMQMRHLMAKSDSPAARLQAIQYRRSAPRQPIMGILSSSKQNNFVFLGDPGSGKSSLLRYVAQKIVKGESERWVLPVLIPLREYWYHWKMHPKEIGGLLRFAAVKL